MQTAKLSNGDLLVGLSELVKNERGVVVRIIEHIAEVDKRQLYREEACSSMFSYCVERLGFSEDAAYRRIQVARLSLRLPAILFYLESGQIHLSGLSHLAPHLTEENHQSVLERACHKTRREIDVLCAELAPRPDIPEKVRALPTPRTPNPALQLVPEQVARPVQPVRTTPIAPERFAIQVTVGKQGKDKLDRARELLPGCDLEEVMEKALTLLVENLEKKRFAKTDRPRQSEHKGSSRRVPNAVKRAVFERDQGQCTYEDQLGRRCTSGAVEFDHAHPYALGGETSVDNLRLRCKAHNLLAAEQGFTQAFIHRMQQRPQL